MRLVVIGAGAIGTVIAAHVEDVVLVARGARLAALREHGLILETPRGTIAKRVNLEWHRRDDDVICIATKTNDVAAIVADLPHNIPVACFTNGIAAERIAHERIDRVYAVCVMCPATHVDPRSIQSYGSPVAGMFDIGPRDRIAIELAEVLTCGGLPARAIEDIGRYKRAKLILNLANAVDALCGFAARSSELVAAIREEGRKILALAGLDVASPEEEAARRGDFTTLDKPSGGSTWQSLARGTPIESVYLNGEIVALAEQLGATAPLNAAILAEIEIASRRGAAPGSYDLRELERSILTIGRNALQ